MNESTTYRFYKHYIGQLHHAILTIANIIMGFLFTAYQTTSLFPSFITKDYIAAAIYSIGVMLIIYLVAGLYVKKSAAKRIQIINYHLNHDTGVLYDTNMDFRNISLKQETINELLSVYYSEPESDEKISHLRKKAYEAGRRFHQEYNAKLIKKAKQNDKDKVFSDILKYDSTSGMGKFTLLSAEKASHNYIEIQVLNCFTKPRLTEPFFGEYIRGIAEKLFNQVFTYTCESIGTDDGRITIKYRTERR